MEAALWAFWHTGSFEAGALAAVNLGDDADTTGAIYGQLAGAYYALEGIPRHWRGRVAQSDRILGMADGLMALMVRNRDQGSTQ
jgi:ADP-ribosyl-[dinitrogen reductase] hydrolase